MPAHKGQLYMKADCNGCRALQEQKCVLGFKILLERPDPTDSFSYYVPMEHCPKPRTHDKLNKELARRKAEAELFDT